MQSAIVCVDDDWNILDSLGRQLKRSFSDYDLEFANSGEDALALCDKLTAEGKEIALIISDQRMPKMSGDDLLIQLHGRYPKALKIMLTGQADASSVGNVVNAAALYRYISKPWDETDLILTVTEALRCFQQEQQLAEQNELLKKTNATLKSSLSFLEAALEATADGILVLDKTGQVVSFNQKFAKIWNFPRFGSGSDQDRRLEIVLEHASEQLTESDKANFRTLVTQMSVEARDCFPLKSGHIIEYHAQPQQLAGEIVGQVWSFRDVTQEKQAAAAIEHQALHDALTNLPNRILFHQKLAAALRDAVSGSKQVAVMFLDLDEFKEVNDTLGHTVGDLLLQKVTQRLLDCLREEDVLARWGGDEFVLLLSQIRDRKDVNDVAQRFIEVLQPHFVIADRRLTITASVGIAVYPHDGGDGHTLLQHADMALYQAKKCGRNNYQHYQSVD